MSGAYGLKLLVAPRTFVSQLAHEDEKVDDPIPEKSSRSKVTQENLRAHAAPLCYW